MCQRGAPQAALESAWGGTGRAQVSLTPGVYALPLGTSLTLLRP